MIAHTSRDRPARQLWRCRSCVSACLPDRPWAVNWAEWSGSRWRTSSECPRSPQTRAEPAAALLEGTAERGGARRRYHSDRTLGPRPEDTGQHTCTGTLTRQEVSQERERTQTCVCDEQQSSITFIMVLRRLADLQQRLHHLHHSFQDLDGKTLNECEREVRWKDGDEGKIRPVSETRGLSERRQTGASPDRSWSFLPLGESLWG